MGNSRRKRKEERKEKGMIPSTVERVPLHTDAQQNEAIRRQTEKNVSRFDSGDSQAISTRLKELDHEWDIERALETNAAVVSLIGSTLGAAVYRRFFAIPALVAGFLLQHALQGWCPPVPLFRRLGFRTQPEIEQERYALKNLRGDFDHSHSGRMQPTHEVMAAVRA